MICLYDDKENAMKGKKKIPRTTEDIMLLKPEEKMKYDPEAKKLFGEEAATLELTIDALDKKQAEYEDYMSKLNAQWAGHVNALSAKQKEKEEYDSLWKEKEDTSAPEDPMEAADSKEAFSTGPAIVDVADTPVSVEAPATAE